MEEENDEYEDGENDVDLHENNVGDLEKYSMQANMDHSIPYSRCYASKSDDNGPIEEIDEEGFTTKAPLAFEKVLGRDHRIPLFKDLSLADEVVVDGGKGIVLGARPTSYRDMEHAKNGISPGLKFETFLELKMWFDNFSFMHYHPHKVVHSDVKVCYTVACEEDGCSWIVRARPWKG